MARDLSRGSVREATSTGGLTYCVHGGAPGNCIAPRPQLTTPPRLHHRGVRAAAAPLMALGRADGIKITALKIEGVKSTPGPPDGPSWKERLRDIQGSTTHNDWSSDAPHTENTPGQPSHSQNPSP
jgi:hypothetical protein